MTLSEIDERMKVFNARWCRGREPTIQQMLDMAKVLGCKLEWRFEPIPRKMVEGDIGLVE